MATPKYNTIVIGGGVAGSACALLRARKGERVVIAERSGYLSPTLRGFVRRGTYMDSGFHYTGSMGPEGFTRRLLHELGLAEPLGNAAYARDAVDHLRFLKPAFDFSFPQGWDALEQSLCKVFPADFQGLRSFLAEVRSSWEQGQQAFLKDRGKSLGSLFLGAGQSLQEGIERSTNDPLLQALLSSHGILYGAAAKETSLFFHSQIVGSYYESACMIKGGGRLWVDAFENALREANVELMCGRSVSRICLDDQRRFTAVELDTGETLSGDRCISTAHPKVTLAMMPPNVFSPAYRKRVGGLEETPSAVVLYGRCRSPGFSGNLILADEPHAALDWSRLPVERRPFFVSSPEETGGISVICPASLADVPGNGDRQSPGRPKGYHDWKMQLMDRLVRRLSTSAHDLLGDFEPLDVATPLTFRDRLSSPEGGLYGVKHRMVDMPLLPRTAAGGLYLSGQAVVAPGVLGALCAGFLTDSCIVE
ncbi:MAG: NAD(P)/FAD-dependent oxidoreductase [Sedimentisphaerales bacterium]|nr:NAD(P)/FAD-dependent oxidoreductase [Sedimentisphaerales bacterium]